MMMKRYIIAALALLTMGNKVWADTSRLTAADGWTKITTIPSSSDIANNYYVFVDNSNDLMLGVAKGVNQNTKWYSLGVYYQTSVEPTSADMNGKLWTLETYSTGFAMRNVEYPVYAFQTEWNAAWEFDTNDVTIPNEWTQVNLAYADGSWTIQNGKYPESGYLGPWTDANFTNGAECAANKSGANVGHFQIYTITRTQFKQNLLDNASAGNPVDLTPWYVTNATFDGNSDSDWTTSFSANSLSWWGSHAFSNLGAENYQQVAEVKQTLTLPNGKYIVSLQGATNKVSDEEAYVFATHNGSTQKTYFTQSTVSTADGSKWNDMQYNLLLMMQDRSYGQVQTPEVTVTTGSLTIGYKNEGGWSWDVFDNFKLYCTGVDLSAYVADLADLVDECNDFIDSDVVPTACETAISTAISTYNDTYETAKEYSNAIIALTAVLNTYRNDTDLQAAYAAYKAFRSHVQGLENTSNYSYVDEGSPTTHKATLDGVITSCNTTVEAATAAATITAEISTLRAAALTFVSNVTAEAGNPFNLMFLASQTISDWKKKDGSAAGEVTWAVSNRGDLSFAENYEETAATTGTVLYQTVSALPAGYYKVGMYAMAAYTPGRGIATEATEGDANRSFAFAGDLGDASSIQRTAIPIPFKSSFDLSELTTLDVNVHLIGAGTSNNLTFGVQKDANGSNWHFAQIMGLFYSKDPDLTELMTTRDALVAEANGILNGADAAYLTSTQQDALQDAIDDGEAADNFDDLNTVTLTTLPNAINTAKSQISTVKANRVLMIAALERFENDYNLADGTDYRRLTMSAKAWTDLLDAVNDVTEALDDVSQASDYGTLKDALIAQMDATDASLRLFKSYKAMVAGCQALSIAEGTTYAASSYMDTDATENTAIAALNTVFISYREAQSVDIDMSGFLGANLDFSETQGSLLVTGTLVYDLVGWEETYSNVQANERIQTNADGHSEELYLRSNWTDKNPVLEVAKLKMLPEGDYQLSLSWNSPMTNMINHSAYVLGGTSNAIGEATSGATTLTYDFTVSGSATNFDFILGFQKQNSGNSGAEIVADNITLTCKAGTPFHIAYTEASAAYDDTDATTRANTAAAKAATDEYAAYDGDEDDLLTAGERGDAYWQAVYVLRNAKTIAENSGDATSLVANADLMNTTKDGNFPTGWTGTYTGDEPGGNAWIGEQDGEQVFNIWAANITLIDMMQTINNLPQGAYRLSIDMGTSNLPVNGDGAPVFNFVNPAGMSIGASQMVTTDNTGEHRAFDTYTSAAEVGAAHSATIGIRSEGHYFQMKDVKLEYIGNAATAAAETDASYLRQDYFWNDRGSAECNISSNAKYTNARGVRLYPTNPNQIITANSGQISNDRNVVVDGVCANLVITDVTGAGSSFQITDATGTFRATSASYSRPMPTNRWGTLILPFPVQARDGLAFYTLREVDEGEGTMTFNREGKKFDANTPLVYRITDGATTLEITASDVDVALTTAEQNDETSIADWEAEGTYARTTKDKGEGYYYISNDKFWLAETKDVNINPFRAWFHYTGSSPVKAFSIAFNEDWTDGVEELTMDNGEWTMDGKVYDLQGRKVSDSLHAPLSTLKKGIYIVNGRKVFVK